MHVYSVYTRPPTRPPTHTPTHTHTHIAHFLGDVINTKVLFHSVPFLIRVGLVSINCFRNSPYLQNKNLEQSLWFPANRK